MGKNDEEQVDLFKRSTLNNDKLASIRHGHITAIQAKQELDSKVWDTYYKFTFIRDPFERFLSYAFFFFGNDPLMQKYPVLQLKELIKLVNEYYYEDLKLYESLGI